MTNTARGTGASCLRITFRPIGRHDFPMLGRWLRTPHVARWWADDSTAAGLEDHYGGNIDGTEPSEVFIAERDDIALGLAQRFRIEAYPAYCEEVATLTSVPPFASSIDYLIGPADAIGRGWGAQMIREFTERLWRDDPATTAIVVPVHVENHASWRALERVGFRRVATGKLSPDNPADTTDHFVYRLDRA